MKRILSILLCLTFLLSLVGCGGGGNSANQQGTASSSEATKTEVQTSSDNKNETETPKGFDENAEHMFLATDIANHSVVVFDLNACEGDYELLKNDDIAVVWEWDADDDPNCKIKPGAGIDSAKYRYSEYYERDVIIACSSNGWAGVIDYEAKSLLWEYNIGNGPHSIEMLPNGDVVVACSSDPGALAYVPLSAGITKPVSSIPSLYCHGVSWDPENEWLWVLEDTGVYAAVINNMGTAEGKIVRVAGSGSEFGTSKTGTAISGGHAFSPIYGEPGKYWASSGSDLWQFDATKETISNSYARHAKLNAQNNIKGIASFPDGTVVQTVAQLGGENTTSYDWSSNGFRIITRELSSGKVATLQDKVTVVLFDRMDREFYKVQPFTKDYQ